MSVYAVENLPRKWYTGAKLINRNRGMKKTTDVRGFFHSISDMHNPADRFSWEWRDCPGSEDGHR